MRHNWSVLVVAVFLAVVALAERLSASYVRNLRAERQALEDQIRQREGRCANAAGERQNYLATQALAGRILGQLRWESDSTGILKWFGETAAQCGVYLANSKILPPERGSPATVAGTFQRVRLEARLRGTYWGLAQYVERVESSPMPMVIENFVLAADRDSARTGELAITVSCLHPAATTAQVAGIGGIQ